MTITDQQLFLQQIAAVPANTHTRLVYADFLDETGDAVDASRAEFVRVQCELVGVNSSVTEIVKACPKRVWDATEYARYAHLSERESTLLAAHEVAFRCRAPCPECGGTGCHLGSAGDKDNPICDCCHGTGDVGGLLRKFEYRGGAEQAIGPPTPVRLKWERGFPDTVTVPRLEDVLTHPALSADDGPTPLITTPWAQAVCRYWPVTRFVPLDRTPLEVFPSVWCWSRGGPLEERHRIPEDVFAELVNPKSFAERCDYPAADAATDALARAIGRIVRRVVYGNQPRLQGEGR